jgi:hypothetical protein
MVTPNDFLGAHDFNIYMIRQHAPLILGVFGLS